MVSLGVRILSRWLVVDKIRELLRAKADEKHAPTLEREALGRCYGGTIRDRPHSHGALHFRAVCILAGDNCGSCWNPKCFYEKLHLLVNIIFVEN